MFEHGPSDRMQLVGMGELLHPGCCIVCGNGTCEKGYIRLDVSFEFEGEGYLCWYCTVQSAEILGCMVPDEVKILKDNLEMVNERATDLRKELELSNERLAAYDTVLRGIDLSPDGSRSVSRKTTVEQSGQSVPDAGSTHNVSGESEPESAESVEGSDPGTSTSTKPGDNPSGSKNRIIL